MGIDIRRAEQLHGWMEPDELVWLAQMAQYANSVCEVGVWKGRSTRVLVDHCPGTVYVVDNWCDASETADLRNAEMSDRGPTAIEQDFRQEFTAELASGKVRLFKGHSPEVAPMVLLASGGVDFAFIDADHAFEGCMNDIRAYRQVVRSGGVLAGHDYTTAVHPGVRKAVDLSFGRAVSQGPRSIWWVKL